MDQHIFGESWSRVKGALHKPTGCNYGCLGTICCIYTPQSHDLCACLIDSIFFGCLIIKVWKTGCKEVLHKPTCITIVTLVTFNQLCKILNLEIIHWGQLMEGSKLDREPRLGCMQAV